MWSMIVHLIAAFTSLIGSTCGHGDFHKNHHAHCDTVAKGYQCNTTISHNWGNYAPYFSVPSDISDEVPDGCAISFVNLLSRHGARSPTSSKTAKYAKLFQQIHSQTTSYSAAYKFIETYTYDLGANDLTALGQQEMINSGLKFVERYRPLTELYTPFFRASGSPRVVESAQNFSQGFHRGRRFFDRTYPYPILIISEDAGQNNTLHVHLCNNYENGPDSDISNIAEKIWRNVWISDVQWRVNSNLVGAELSPSQIIYLLDQCPFNTIANANGTISPFCGLFNSTEWSYYNYYRSLSKWYADLQGNPLGPTQGVGYAAELIARMTNDRRYVTNRNSFTSINHTLDDVESTFPLGVDLTNPLYADFSHDDDLGSIFAALGLYNTTADLSNATLETSTQTNGYSAAWTVPFASRAYFEKMLCFGEPEEFVRVIINDRVVPLQNCDADALGRCTLSKFVASQSFVTDGGLWGQCFN